MTRTDRRRFPAIAALALVGAVLGLLFSPVQAQADSAPAKPTGLSATASHDRVVLTWDDPDDDTITGYVILRRVRENDVGGEFSELVPDTGTAATTYTDDTVQAGTTYTYRIKAINEHGVSERSLWFHIDTPSAPVPAQPTGLSATATHDQVVLTWDDPDDDSITGYVILRRVRENDVGGEFSVLVADTGTAATTYTDDSVKTGTTYTYRIKAINEHGVSERSRWFHIDIPAAPEATFVEGDDQDEQGGEDGGGAPGHATPPGPGGRANVSEGGTDLPATTATTGEVDVGGTVTGNINPIGDTDWFKVNLVAGTRYQFDLEGEDTNRGTLGDPFLALRHPCCVDTIVGSRDQGVGDNARLIYTPEPPYSAGVFYLTVEGAASTRGTYTLSVIVLGPNGNSEADDDFPATTSTAGRVDVGASATGNIDAVNDEDWFRVDLEADKLYQIDLEGVSTSRGALNDPGLGLFDGSATFLLDDDDGGTRLNSQLVYNAASAGTHYLRAIAAATGTGTYTLSVREVLEVLVPTAVPPGGLGPSEVPGPVRNVEVPGTSRLRVVYWDAPDETETGAQWITEFRIYASTGAGCDGWKAAEYEVEHPGFTTPPEYPDGTTTGFKYFKIVEMASDTDDVTIQFGVSAVNELGEGPCVGEPAPPPSSKLVVADGPPGLVPNAPNPFNANTLIPYRLDADGPVRLEIYNLLGQSMRTLVDEVQAAGTYWVRWDARDGRGAAVAAGVYLVRLHYPGGVQTQRMLYLK